jgi:hypothetical protein
VGRQQGLGEWDSARSGDHISCLAGEYLDADFRQRQMKPFAFAGAVFNQEDAGVRYHFYSGISVRDALALNRNIMMCRYDLDTYIYHGKDIVIDDVYKVE